MASAAISVDEEEEVSIQDENKVINEVSADPLMLEVVVISWLTS